MVTSGVTRGTRVGSHLEIGNMYRQSKRKNIRKFNKNDLFLFLWFLAQFLLKMSFLKETMQNAIEKFKFRENHSFKPFWFSQYFVDRDAVPQPPRPEKNPHYATGCHRRKIVNKQRRKWVSRTMISSSGIHLRTEVVPLDSHSQ